jgi:8-oxo-dGTP diphosphatase
MIRVAAIILMNEGKVMIAKRKPIKSLGGYWEFPGGKIEGNETPEDCLIRELQEEFSVQVEVDKHIKSVEHDYGKFKIFLMGYGGRIKSGTFKLVDHDEVAWIEPFELLTYNLAPADVPIAEEIIKRRE